MRIVSFILIAAIVAAAAIGLTRGDASNFSPSNLQRHVEALSDDALRGRDTGKKGVFQAEGYIAKHFNEAGLTPLPGHDDFFHDFELYRSGYDSEGTWLELSAPGSDSPQRGALGGDFRPFGFSDDGEHEAPVVWAGYGIVAEDADWDDYAGLDVEGKIVLVLRYTPFRDDEEHWFNVEEHNHANFTTKAQQAQDRGALGMLLVTGPAHSDAADDLRVGGRMTRQRPEPRDTTPPAASGDDDGDVEEEPAFLALQISRELADKLVAPTGRTLLELQNDTDGGTKPADITTPLADARAAVETSEEALVIPARNVVGFLEGSDPELKNEWIVVGGHHDHIGAFEGRGDTIFNGADDNASGTTGVLTLAQTFAAAEEGPRRSFVFATFSAEEKGLHGSTWLVENEILTAEDVVFMLNLDMIGRNPEDPVDAYGDGFVSGLRPIVEAANAEVGLDLNFGGDDYQGNSDHNAFNESYIPWMFFFTGLHEDYHGLFDHADKLAYDQMSQILQVAHGTLDELANADRAPRYVHNIGWLGVRIELQGDEGAELATITRVAPASRAEEAGFVVGDVIQALGGTPLAQASDVGPGFGDVDPGTKLDITVARADVEKTFAVERARVGYLGVFPGEPTDEDRQKYGIAEGDGLLLTRVTEGGPAATSGLQDNDIVLQIAGQPGRPPQPAHAPGPPRRR